MKYVICVENKNYEGSLELRKLYKVSDETLIDSQLISIIDETGESYLYNKNMFMEVEISNEVKEKIELEPA
jgi:hypothetical protein